MAAWCGEWTRKTIDTAGRTQREAASLTQTSIQNVNRYYHGQRCPSDEWADSLCDAFGLPRGSFARERDAFVAGLDDPETTGEDEDDDDDDDDGDGEPREVA